eukprot:TRINITY_DN13217_c0_g1_i1.p1 TRINITY_DN13217_c0_g1~~TRINITY_DN13217_c0_g1_i1.p1  ORF type:complete len:545 (-),score=167.58 TRINITY_DN13217_c0_g1_i1:502-2136(-)
MDYLVGKLKHEAVKLKREAKKIAELETPLEANIREALSDKHYGCANSVLYELAEAANSYHERRKIMNKVWEKLQSTPDRWCRILKTLTCLDFLLKNGPDSILGEVQSEQNIIRRLQNFQFSDEGKDRGPPVREKAKAIMDLLGDGKALKAAREQAKEHRSKMGGGVGGSANRDSFGGGCAGSRTSGGDNGSGHLSRRAFEERFRELKEQQQAEEQKRQERHMASSRRSDSRDGDRRSDSEDDRDRRRRRRDDSDSPREKDRRDDADLDVNRHRRKLSGERQLDGDEFDYSSHRRGLSGERSRRDDSESPQERRRGDDGRSPLGGGGGGGDVLAFMGEAPRGGDKKPAAAAAPPVDLLDMFDEPASVSAPAVSSSSSAPVVAASADDGFGDFSSSGPTSGAAQAGGGGGDWGDFAGAGAGARGANMAPLNAAGAALGFGAAAVLQHPPPLQSGGMMSGMGGGMASGGYAAASAPSQQVAFASAPAAAASPVSADFLSDVPTKLRELDLGGGTGNGAAPRPQPGNPAAGKPGGGSGADPMADLVSF